jgi:hypothetical protein
MPRDDPPPPIGAELTLVDAPPGGADAHPVSATVTAVASSTTLARTDD